MCGSCGAEGFVSGFLGGCSLAPRDSLGSIPSLAILARTAGSRYQGMLSVPAENRWMHALASTLSSSILFS